MPHDPDPLAHPVEPTPTPVPAPVPEPIPPQPVPVFPPIPATNPSTTPAVPEETFGQWFLTGCNIAKRSGSVYDLEAFWIKGNPEILSTTSTNYIIRDLLSQQSLYENPEISQIAPEFIAALAAAGKRLGVL